MTVALLLAASALLLWPKGGQPLAVVQPLEAADPVASIRAALEARGQMTPSVIKSLNCLAVALSKGAKT